MTLIIRVCSLLLTKMNKLYYIANIRLPTEKAHGIQIMEMCRAFALAGKEVELIVPKRGNALKVPPFEYYHMEPTFSIKFLSCVDFLSWGWLGFWLQQVSFSEHVSWYLLNHGGEFYTRNPLVALMLKLMNKEVIWEGHQGETNFLIKILISIRLKMVMITNGLKNLYVSMGADPKKIFVSPDAVRIEEFAKKISREEARNKTGLSGEKIVLYTGHLYDWKGADILAQASKLLPESISVNFVGGTDHYLELFREAYGEVPNIKIWGKKPHQAIPLYLASADILVIPNSGKGNISKLYTSPMKLFEYMASGRPIIASDLPSMREVLGESIAYFFKADDPKDLARVIKLSLENTEEANRKAEKAFQVVQNYSWENRARNILEFFKK